MALADVLGLNLVETFLAFIQSDDAQRRRLLDIAGASGAAGRDQDELADVGGEPRRLPEDEPDDEASTDGLRARRRRRRRAGAAAADRDRRPPPRRCRCCASRTSRSTASRSSSPANAA